MTLQGICLTDFVSVACGVKLCQTIKIYGHRPLKVRTRFYKIKKPSFMLHIFNYCCFKGFFHVERINSTIIGNISSLPISISRIKTVFDKAE